MAIGLTDHGWSYREYIWLPMPKDAALTRQMDERIARLLTPTLQGYSESRAPANLLPVQARRRKATPMPKAA
jgi:hypothetical protein